MAAAAEYGMMNVDNDTGADANVAAAVTDDEVDNDADGGDGGS